MKILKKIWLAEWFRVWFILFGIWWAIPLVLYLDYVVGFSMEMAKNITIGLYLTLFYLACRFNG